MLGPEINRKMEMRLLCLGPLYFQENVQYNLQIIQGNCEILQYTVIITMF